MFTPIKFLPIKLFDIQSLGMVLDSVPSTVSGKGKGRPKTTTRARKAAKRAKLRNRGR